HHELRVEHGGVGVTHAAGAGGVDEQDGPFGAARAGRESFVAVDEIAAVDNLHCRTKANLLTRFRRLRFAAPGYPFLTAFDDATKPARLLFSGAHAVEQHE